MGERLLLVHPRSTSAIGFSNLICAEPLSLETICCLLDDWEIRILDLRIENDLKGVLRRFDPHYVGVTCSFTTDVPHVLEIARTVKAVAKNAMVIVGGHHATLCPSDFASPFVDHVILGEGEVALKQLLEGQRRERCVKAEIIEDLDSLPNPRRDLTKGHRKRFYLGFKRPLAICETSRGCPYRCLFCSVWVFYRGRYRKKSPERVLGEIASIRAPYVLFTDDNFLQDVERGYVLAELLRTSGEKKRFIAQLRSDAVVEHKDLIKLWRECGLEGVFIGFEKIKDEDLRTINKRNSVRNNEIALDVLRTLKIDVWSSFIVDPSFEKRDFEELLSYVREKIIKNPTFSILTPLPGTELFQRMKAHLTTHDPRFFDIAHVVLPTRLNLREFYEEFCRLYRKSYSAPSLIREGILCLMRHINSLPDLMRMLYNAYRLTRPVFYLRLHESAAGRTINRRYTL